MAKKTIDQIRIEELHTLSEALKCFEMANILDSQRMRILFQEMQRLYVKIEAEVREKRDYEKIPL